MVRRTRVTFGPEIWSLQSEGGISRYFQELIRNLSKMDVEGKILAWTNSNSRLSDLNVEGFQIQRLDNNRNLRKGIDVVLANDLSEEIIHPTYYSARLDDYRSPMANMLS